MQKLPVSITNWIILSDYLKESSEVRIFIKVIREYSLILPLYKLYEIFALAERRLSENEFELLVEELWKNIYELEVDHCLKRNYLMRQAFAEMYEILKHCNHEVTSRVPEKFVAMLKKRMDTNWVVNLDFSKELRDMDMLVDTRVLLHWVYRDFLCSETERKKIIEEKTLEATASGEMYPTLSLYEVMDMLG